MMNLYGVYSEKLLRYTDLYFRNQVSGQHDHNKIGKMFRFIASRGDMMCPPSPLPACPTMHPPHPHIHIKGRAYFVESTPLCTAFNRLENARIDTILIYYQLINVNSYISVSTYWLQEK